MKETGLAGEGGWIGSRAVQDWRVKGSEGDGLEERGFTYKELKDKGLEVKGGFG